MRHAETVGGGGALPSSDGSAPSTVRRERLEHIRQREALKDDLISKFRDHFSQRSRGADEASLASATLRREVGHFVDSAALVTASNLSRLEGRLLRRAQAGSSADSDGATVSAYTVGSGSVAPTSSGSRASRRPASCSVWGAAAHVAGATGPGRLGSSSARGQGGVAAETAPPGAQARSARGPAAINWAVLDRLAAQQLGQDQLRQRQQGAELQRRLRQDLDKQMADVQLGKEREREEEQQFHRLQVEDGTHWQEKERAKEAARQQKLQVERSERAVQMEADKKRRTQERLLEKLEAQNHMESVSRELESDRRQAEERWEVCREQARQALQVSSASTRLREDLQQQQAQRESRSVEEYQRLRSGRDQQARDEHEKEQGRRQALQLEAAKRAEAARQEQEAEAARVLAQLAEKNRRAAEAEAAAAGRLAEERQQTQAYVVRQIREKQEARRTELERRKQQRLVEECDAKIYQEEERRRETSKRSMNVEHRSELERQMATKSSSAEPGLEIMTACEMQLNRQLLDRVVGGVF